jgi:hypothetical protein
MLAAVTHILPLTTIRRERMLPVPGRVVVRKGQKVVSTDVIAEAKLNPEHLLLDISRGLGLPEEEADRHLHCKAGMQVNEGDVLAGPVGFTKRVVRAPRNGKVIVVGSGQVMLQLDSPPDELRAGIPGTVTALVDERGAVIETTGALIQGVWGNGRVDYGLMYVLLQSPDETLTPDRLDVSMRGSVVLGGHCDDVEVLRAAAGLPVRGLILASMDAALLPYALRARFPVILLEGFGKIPLNAAAYRLLTTNERRDVALNAEPWDRYRGIRPEVIIPLPAAGELPLPQDGGTYEAGQQVRVVQSAHHGAIGKIEALPPGPILLQNGIKARCAEIQLESGDKVVIPLTNLEVLK